MERLKIRLKMNQGEIKNIVGHTLSCVFTMLFGIKKMRLINSQLLFADLSKLNWI